MKKILAVVVLAAATVPFSFAKPQATPQDNSTQTQTAKKKHKKVKHAKKASKTNTTATPQK